MIIIYEEDEVVKNVDGRLYPKKTLEHYYAAKGAGCIYEGKPVIMKSRGPGISRTLVKIFKSLGYDYQ